MRLHVLSRFQRSGRDLAAQCGKPCPGQPVGGGHRNLPAHHRSVRRQGRQATPGEATEERAAEWKAMSSSSSST